MRWGEMCVWGAYPRGGLVPHIYIWARVAPGRVVLGEALQRGCRLNFASDLGYDPGCDPVPTTCPRLSLVREPGETRPPRRSVRLLGPVSAPRSPAGRDHCVVECSFLPAQLRGAGGGPTSSVSLQGGLRRWVFRWCGLRSRAEAWGFPVVWPWVLGWSSRHSVKCIRWDEMCAGGTNPRASSVPHVYISRCGARMRVPVRR